MRTIVIIAVGVVLILGTAFITMPRVDSSVSAQVSTNEVLADYSAKIETAKLDLKRRQLGDKDFMLYQHCHAAAPTTKAHQADCGRVEKRLAAMEAKSKNW